MIKSFLSFVTALIVISSICIFAACYKWTGFMKEDAEIAEMQKLYNEQNFEAIYYLWDEESRHGIGWKGKGISEEQHKAEFVEYLQKKFNELGKIKSSRFNGITSHTKQKPAEEVFRYQVEFEKSTCEVSYTFTLQNDGWKFKRFSIFPCSN